MPSLPATDDGSGSPLTEDLSTGSDDGEDIASDADAAEAGEVPAAAGSASGTRTAGAEPRDGEADAGSATAGPDGEAGTGPDGETDAGPDGETEFTEADAAFHSAPQEANATVAANGTETEDAPGPDAAPAIGESGRWFRPAKAKKKYVPTPPEEPAEPGDAVATEEPAEPGDAVATEEPPEQAAEPVASTPSGLAEEAGAETEADGDGDAAAAGWASQEQPEWVSPQEARPTEVWTPPNQAAGPAPSASERAPSASERATSAAERATSGRAPSAAGRVGSAAGRMSALLRPGGAALPSPPEGPVLAPSPEGPVLAPLQKGPVLAPVGRRLSRRRMLQAGLIGGAGVAALPLLARVSGITRTDKQAVGFAFSMNTNWLFGGRYTAGSEISSYDDGNFAPVTVPHTVVPLSWKDWNYPAWQQVWIYRRHFSGAGLLDQHRPGNRILVDFDGVMVNATVSVNDHVVATHQGGYLPFSA
ncbi:MAG: hypothetical protein ACRDOC_15700, partial [Streptosporangiaceae bacterium]